MYLTQGLHRSLQRHPAKDALIHLGDGAPRRLTFAELLPSVARRAAALAARGVGAGDRVAMLAPNGDDLVQALLACWWLGAVACPLNTRWSAAELADALADSGAALLLVDESLAQLAPKSQAATTTLAAFAAQANDL
jgi:acyl-CoA synthetase (AMP-forming)/AMP-acid ligase II